VDISILFESDNSFMKSEKLHNTFNRAFELHVQGQLTKCFKLYVRLYTDGLRSKIFLHSYGALLFQRKNFFYAKSIVDEAIKLYPNSESLLELMGLISWDLGEGVVAENYLKDALTLAPNRASTLNNLAKIFMERNQISDALPLLDACLLTRSDFAEARFNRAIVLNRLNIRKRGRDDLEFLVHSNPDHYDAKVNLAALLVDLSKPQEAFKHFIEAIKLSRSLRSFPTTLETILIDIAALICFPVIYASKEHLHDTRNFIRAALDRLQKMSEDTPVKTISEHATLINEWLLRVSLFYLPYQGLADVDLYKKYSKIVRNFNPEICSMELKLEELPHTEKKMRVLVLSEYFGLHATCWLTYFLDSIAIPLEITYGVLNDCIDIKFLDLQREKGAVVKYFKVSSVTMKQLVGDIVKENYDYVFYPDIGMTPSSRFLSNFRLGKRQLCHWAHPVTSGSSAIDMFLTAEYMEPANLSDHYAEHVRGIPGFGLLLPNLSANKISIKKDLYSDSVSPFIAITAQSLFKYHPENDQFWPRLVKKIPNIQISFIEHPEPEVTAVFLERLKTCFRQYGLPWEEHIRLLGRMSNEEFQDVFRYHHVCIDSFGWSGGNTTLDALSVGCPVLTIPGQLMRSRHTYAALKTIGMTGLIFPNQDALIEVLYQMSNDRTGLDRIRAQILENFYKLGGGYEQQKAFEKILLENNIPQEYLE
jgi:protein O-GlcNAc transferase